VKNLSVQNAIEDASSYLRLHRQRRLIIYLSAGLSVVLLLAVLISFVSLPLSLVFGGIALALLAIVLSRLGLLGRVKQHDALQLLDSHLELKERFITLEELEREMLERPQYVDDPRVEYIKSELAPRVVEFNSQELPRELPRNQKILLLLGVIFFTLSMIMLPFSGFFPAEQIGARQIQAIEDLLNKEGALPEPVQEALREVLQKIEEDGLTSDSVIEAIARAEQAIDIAEQQASEQRQRSDEIEAPSPTPTPAHEQEEEQEQEEEEESEEKEDSDTFPQDSSSEQEEEEQEGDQEEREGEQGEGEGESEEGSAAGQSASDQESEEGSEDGDDQGEGEDQASGDGESDQPDPHGDPGEAEGDSEAMAEAKQALEDLKQEQESQQQEQEGETAGLEPDPGQDEGASPDPEEAGPEPQGDPEQAKQQEEADGEDQQDAEDRSADPASIEESEAPGDESDGGGASLPEPGEETTWEPGDEIAERLPDAQFEEKIIGDTDEIIDPRFGVDTGEIVEHQGEQDPRTALDDVELTRSEPGKDSSKQPIPLEYRDLIR